MTFRISISYSRSTIHFSHSQIHILLFKTDNMADFNFSLKFVSRSLVEFSESVKLHLTLHSRSSRVRKIGTVLNPTAECCVQPHKLHAVLTRYWLCISWSAMSRLRCYAEGSRARLVSFGLYVSVYAWHNFHRMCNPIWSSHFELTEMFINKY